jgi:flagellar motor switch protein FliG
MADGSYLEGIDADVIGPGLDGASRVAMLLLSLLPAEKDLVGLLLSRFSADELEAISLAASRISIVSPASVTAEISSFLESLVSGPLLLGSEEKSRILEEVAVSRSELLPDLTAGNPDTWQACSALDADKLVMALCREPAALAARWISFLTKEAATQTLTRLEPKRAAEILHCLATFPSTISDQGRLILEDFVAELVQSETRNSGTEADNVIDMITAISPELAEPILGSLSRLDAELVNKIKNSMFLFEDFPLLSPQARSLIIEELDSDTIAKCLVGAPSEIVGSFLDLLGARTRRMIEQELRISEKIDVADQATARQQVTVLAVRFIKQGKIERPQLIPQ